jgi:hypothetical protein
VRSTEVRHLNICADDFAVFGDEECSTFYLVTNTALLDCVTLTTRGRYKHTEILALTSQALDELFSTGRVPLDAHVLALLPECLAHSVPRETLGRRKLLIMACRSGQIGIPGIRHFLDCGLRTDPSTLERTADEFFAQIEAAHFLRLRAGDCDAVFYHKSSDYGWHEQLGYLKWGDQQVFPAGEIACFLVPLSTTELPDRRFRLNGAIVVQGPVIVQSGPPSFRLEDQQRIYDHLSSNRCGVHFSIEDGIVMDTHTLSDDDGPARAMFEALFSIDSRYRQIFELGFSINSALELFPGNAAMNEVWGPSGGKLHLGLGMLPYTQYHLDVFCRTTRVENDQGQPIFGIPLGSGQ